MLNKFSTNRAYSLLPFPISLWKMEDGFDTVDASRRGSRRGQNSVLEPEMGVLTDLTLPAPGPGSLETGSLRHVSIFRQLYRQEPRLSGASLS